MSAIFIKNLTFYYPGQADAVFENLNLTLDTDWKLALIGRNGRGKTTLLHLLAGKTGGYSGNITARETFEYFPFALPEAPDSLSALYCAVPDLRLWALKKEMNALHLREDVLDRPLQTLSGGEKTKLLLAALFSKEEAFLLIDEPTNHLDEIGRRLVGTYLHSKRGFILVSHDRAFLDLCCDHVLALNRSGTQLRSGSFSDWQRDKAASDAAEAAKNERLKKEISFCHLCRHCADMSFVRAEPRNRLIFACFHLVRPTPRAFGGSLQHELRLKNICRKTAGSGRDRRHPQ